MVTIVTSALYNPVNSVKAPSLERKYADISVRREHISRQQIARLPGQLLRVSMDSLLQPKTQHFPFQYLDHNAHLHAPSGSRHINLHPGNGIMSRDFLTCSSSTQAATQNRRRGHLLFHWNQRIPSWHSHLHCCLRFHVIIIVFGKFATSSSSIP